MGDFVPIPPPPPPPPPEEKAVGTIEVVLVPDDQRFCDGEDYVFEDVQRIMDGDYFVVGDGTHPNVEFEFDKYTDAQGILDFRMVTQILVGDTISLTMVGGSLFTLEFVNGGLPGPGNFAVDIGATIADTVANLVAKIQLLAAGLWYTGDGPVGVHGLVVKLRAKGFGAVQNVPIQHTLSDPEFVVSGMQYGSDAGSVTPGRVGVSITTGQSFSDIYFAMSTAINGATDLDVTAETFPVDGDNLENDNAGALGNVPITVSTLFGNTLTVTGMAGGV